MFRNSNFCTVEGSLEFNASDNTLGTGPAEVISPSLFLPNVPKNHPESSDDSDDTCTLLDMEEGVSYCALCSGASHTHEFEHKFVPGGKRPSNKGKNICAEDNILTSCGGQDICTEDNILTSCGGQDICAEDNILTSCGGQDYSKPIFGYTNYKYHICNYCYNNPKCMHGRDIKTYERKKYGVPCLLGHAKFLDRTVFGGNLSCDCNNCAPDPWGNSKILN
jgi:hypothetical protein